MDFPGKNTVVGYHFLLQGTQGLNLHLLHWQVNSLPLSHQGSPITGQLQIVHERKVKRELCEEESASSMDM